MVFETNECVNCVLPCLGESCPNRHVKHFVCDKCEDEVDELYEYDGMQICEKCLLNEFVKVGD